MLQKYYFNSTVIKALRKTMNHVTLIQKKWRDHRHAMLLRVDFLQTKIWPEQVNYLGFKFIKL